MRFALLVDEDYLPTYVTEIAEMCRTDQRADLVAVLVQVQPREGTGGSRDQNLRERLRNRIVFELRRLELGARPETEQPDLSHLPIIPVEPHWTGPIAQYDENSVAPLGHLNVDVIIRACSGIQHGSILRIAKHGVLSIHCGDPQFSRGSPAGFWEVYYDQPYSGYIIQRLTERLDAGIIVASGKIRTRALWHRNAEALLSTATLHLVHLLTSTPEHYSKTTSTIGVTLAPIRKTPKLLMIVRYVIKFWARYFRQRLITALRHHNRLASKHFQKNWTVTLSTTGDGMATLDRSTKVVAPKGLWLADPNLLKIATNTYRLMVEECAFGTSKGSIAEYSIRAEGRRLHISRIGTAFSFETHCSFPFQFRIANTDYMICESIETKTVPLFRYAQGERRWIFVKSLLEHTRLADPIIFFQDGFWWILGTSDSATDGDFETLLYAYRSPDVLQERFRPHPANPLSFDASVGRNAGFCQHEGGNFRFAQMHAGTDYGTGVSILKVDDLSPKRFHEYPVGRLQYPSDSRKRGPHTLSIVEGLLAVDHLERAKHFIRRH